jgi:hypothetical protein
VPMAIAALVEMHRPGDLGMLLMDADCTIFHG